MDIRIIQVDSFTPTPFKGNPAGVCLLSDPMPDIWMQQVAAEMNLSETAFVLPQAEGYSLRWFTPTVEVDLCGHATLASAHALWTEGDLDATVDARFETRSGILTAHGAGDWIELNFPAAPCQPTELQPHIKQAIGAIKPVAIAQSQTGFLLVEIEDAAQIPVLEPDFAALKSAPYHGVIVTSKNQGIGQADPPSPNAVAEADTKAPTYDFVSRFFAPALGINEDPVTGAAHCVLAPFWRDRLGKDDMLAYQASPRGGEVRIRYDGGDRVTLGGQAVTVFRGILRAQGRIKTS